jgi:hypothetical protein
LSFSELIQPEKLSAIRIQTNALEQEIKQNLRENLRVVNTNPGILTDSALIIATAKNFAHRNPLASGIYAHLELLGISTAISTSASKKRRRKRNKTQGKKVANTGSPLKRSSPARSTAAWSSSSTLSTATSSSGRLNKYDQPGG